MATSGAGADQPFDKMPERDQNLDFENFQIEFYPVVDKDTRHMLVDSRDDGLIGNQLDLRKLSYSLSGFGHFKIRFEYDFGSTLCKLGGL
jgi:hypothetical protein